MKSRLNCALGAFMHKAITADAETYVDLGPAGGVRTVLIFVDYDEGAATDLDLIIEEADATPASTASYSAVDSDELGLDANSAGTTTISSNTVNVTADDVFFIEYTGNARYLSVQADVTGTPTSLDVVAFALEPVESGVANTLTSGAVS